jgi:transcriptional regulator with XRE-family HTH domain
LIAYERGNRSIPKEKRRAAGLTQANVAKELKRPQSYMAKVEAGKTRLEVIDFIKICLKIDADPTLLIASLKISPSKSGS